MATQTKQEKEKKVTVNKQKTKKEDSRKTKTTAKTSSKEKELTHKLQVAEQKAKEFEDKYVRLSAEFDNYRKRTLKEKMDLTKTAGEDLLVKILPVVDDFERGMKNLNESQNIEGVKEGIALIYNKFKDFLNQNGVKEIEAMGTDFDIDLHDAVTKIPAPDKKLKGKVVDVIEKGYILFDKVIRYSKVVIGE